MKVKYGGFWIKVHGGAYQQNGIPDLIGCVKGLFVGLEVKVPERRDTVTRLQEQTILEINLNGGTALVVTSVEEAEQAMDMLFNVGWKDRTSDE